MRRSVAGFSAEDFDVFQTGKMTEIVILHLKSRPKLSYETSPALTSRSPLSPKP